MFRLVPASFHALESQFISDVLALRKKDPLSSLLVVIPTGRLRTHLQRELLRQSPGLLNIHFLTFFGLAEQILADGPPHEDRVIGESALYREIIRELLEGKAAVPFQLREEFLGAGKTITRGLPGALAGTLKDLRDAGVRVTDALKAALEGHLGPEAESAAPTLELYAHVYDGLQKLRVRTPSDFLRRAAEHTPKSAFFRRQKAVLIYGFYDLTGVQMDLMLALADHPEARVYFPYEKKPAYAFAEKLLQDPAIVGRVMSEEGEEGNVKSLHSTRSQPSPLSIPSSHSTLFTSCSGARDEVWFAAKEIQRLLDDGVAPSEIAVIARRLDPYFSAMRDLFGNHQIPYVTSRNESAGAHPWIKTVRANVREKADNVTAAWAEHCVWARQFVVAPSPGHRTGEGGDEGTSGSALTPALSRLPSGEGALQTAVLESLAQLEILDLLGKPVSREHFMDAWEDKLDALEMPSSSEPFPGVQVLEVQQARGLRFKAVFLLGLNEKTFPRLIREDPFLSDAARSSLAQALGARLGRKLDGYQEERFLFELMQQTAQDYLYLMWQRSDEEGKAVIPSIYIQELLRSQKTKAVRLARSLPEKLKERAASTLTPKELSFLLNRAGVTPDPLYTALGWNTARFNRLLQAHRATESFRPGILALDGLITESETLRSLIAAGYSPSGLEDLAACPYKFYTAHILRVPVPENPAPQGQIAANAMGTLFHRALELYFVSKDLSTACDQAFAEFETDYPGLYPLVIKSSKQLVFSYLSSFLKTETQELKESGFAPAYAEQKLESVVPELGPGLAHVPFRGRMDRIDLKKEGGTWVGRVVDYKSGKAREVSGKMETALIQGKFLQLPIYMGLVRAFLAREKGPNATVESSTLRWLRLEDQGEPEPFLASTFWASPHAKTFIETIKGLVEIAESGHFHIVPSTGEWGHCSRCDYARICRKEHMPTRARAENDPVAMANKERLSRTAKDEKKK